MKSKHPEIDQRYLLLFKIDARNLFNRIKNRQKDYIEIFSLKRSRSVFKDIFSNRYDKASAFDLSHCTQEVLISLDQFYKSVDELFWYLKYTQDMPNTIEDELGRRLIRMGHFYDQLELYIDAELSGQGLDNIETAEEIPSASSLDSQFQLDGEISTQDSEDDFIQDEHFPDPDELAEEDL
jgi:hypothetical protein